MVKAYSDEETANNIAAEWNTYGETAVVEDACVNEARRDGNLWSDRIGWVSIPND